MPAATAADQAPISTVIRDAAGKRVGKAEITREGSLTLVAVRASGLTPGYHAMHVHSVGLCEGAGGFVTALGHVVGDDGATHGDHQGDLPSLYVGDDGRGTLRVKTDAFKPGDLRDADGSAFMLHAGRDNYANIPERYAPGGPDEDTLKTGDAGARIACGPIT